MFFWYKTTYLVKRRGRETYFAKGIVYAESEKEAKRKAYKTAKRNGTRLVSIRVAD